MKSVIAVCSSLLLLQIEVGSYGVLTNWVLVWIVVGAAFALGWIKGEV